MCSNPAFSLPSYSIDCFPQKKLAKARENLSKIHQFPNGFLNLLKLFPKF